MKVILLLIFAALGSAIAETAEDAAPASSSTQRTLQNVPYYGSGGGTSYYGGGGYYGGYTGYGGYGCGGKMYGGKMSGRGCYNPAPGYGGGGGYYYPGNYYGYNYGYYPYYHGNYYYGWYNPWQGYYGPWMPHPSHPPLPVVGRPFRRELNGKDIVAEAVVVEDAGGLWSRQQEAIPAESNLRTQSAKNQDKADVWTDRAVGEHASIASFAAFTIALMTNQAPPALIRDALRAALDELDHAQVSFEVASLFGGQVIEPSALPGSQLSFAQNLTSLALGAAQEGCIDESLSALELAADAQVMLQDADNDGLDDHSVGRATWKIALDESRHAMLAWRTIEWVCAVDETVCHQVMKDVLNPAHMHKALESRFSGRDDMKHAWNKIVSELPMAVASSGGSAVECPTPEEPITPEGGASALALHIVYGVVCAPATK